MQLQETGIEIHSRGVTRTAEYRVSQSAKVMDMFSNMLYKDKIRAAIRELSTNAWDGHIMADNVSQVPDLHLPNHDDCEFRLRDYGTGLTKHEIAGYSDEELAELPIEVVENMGEVERLGIYRVYGASNKDHSNKFNGCMGIGSKSPFAYSRSFTTTSYSNGMKYVFVNAKDENNMPTLKQLFEGPTDEPNGLEVSFVVKPDDISEFETKARSVLSWMPVAFNVTGGCGAFRITERNYSMEGNGWKIRSDTAESCAIMAYVEYPIEEDHFFKDDETEEREDDWYEHYSHSSGKMQPPHVRLLNLGLELIFDTGEVEMDISREGLQYTPLTISHIKDRLDRVLAEIGEQVSKKFKACTCLWDARLLWHELMSGELSGVRELLKLTKVEWRGISIDSADIKCDSKSLPDGVSVVSFTSGYRTPKRSDNVYKLLIRKQHRIYVNDMDRGNYVACQRAILDEDNTCNHIYLVDFEDDVAKQEFCEYIGCLPEHLYLCSSVPKAPKGVSVKVRRENVFVFEALNKHIRNGRHYRDFWKSGTIDYNAGGLYVELNNWKTKKFNGPRSCCDMNGNAIEAIIDALAACGITTPVIVGVKTCVIARYGKSGDWKCFFKWAESKLKEHIDSSKVGDHIASIQAIENFRQKDMYDDLVENSSVSLINSSSPMKKLLDKIAELGIIKDQWESKVAAMRQACKTLEVTMPEDDSTDTLLDLEVEVQERYSVFRLVSCWDCQSERKATAIVEIINLVDSCEGK